MVNRRGEETRQHIKRNAYSLFAAKGFKQVTMKDICEAAKLSRGGLYCHYESTSQIFQEIIDDLLSRQEDTFDFKIKQGQPAVVILNEVLETYKREMLDSGASLSLAIYEFFSLCGGLDRKNALYQQYMLSANSWEKLIQYGIERNEFNHVDIPAVFDLIVFSYQGVRMFSKLMPINEQIPSGIIKEIKKILIRED